MHLDPEDQAALKEVLRLPEKPVESPRDTAAPAEPAPSGDRPEAAPQNAETSAVMAGYFDLMHQFLDQQRRIMECRRPEPELLPLDQNDLRAGSLPFLQTITHWDENRLEASCRLSVHEDNFLRHHILSGPVSEYDADLPGLCCVPLMVSLEIMAEACTLLNGGREIRVIENVKASAWIALDREEVTLEVHAAKLSTDGSRTTARLINHSAGGVIALSADFDCEADWRAEPLPALAEKRAFCWEDQELYARGMFHGPVFQSIRRIKGWNEHGIDAALSEVELTDFFIPDEAPALVLNPILLDALGQLAAYWIIQQIGTDFNCFPSAIERIELYAPCPQQLPGLTCRGRQRPLDPNATDMAAPRLWQFECLTPDGRPLLRAINLVNIFFPVPHQFYQVRMDPLSGRLGEPMPTPDGSGAMLWRLSHLTEAFCTQSGGIFLDILAHALLDAQERQDWRQLKGSPAHRRQWLFGRACIKEAVRFWVYQQTGRLLYPTDIVVCHNDLGAPYVDGWWRDTVAPAPNVSLSHDKRLSLAAVTSPDLPVGIDVEHIERIEQAKFFETAMTQVAMGAREREMLHSFTSNDRKQRLLRLWCAKEAAAKYLGIGLNGTPQEFNVSFLDDDWAQAHVTHRHETVAVTVACRDDAIMALARARAQ
jgi:phosphopantetheine--protein transferase-like protein